MRSLQLLRSIFVLAVSAVSAGAVSQAPLLAQQPDMSALTAEEAKLSCRKMAGRMKVRILELRGGTTRTRPSAVAQGMQQTLTPIFGGTRRGADAAQDEARDLAKLRAMNASLQQRNCPHYDLDAELAKAPADPGPALLKPGRAKKPSPKKAGTGGASPAKGSPQAKPAKPPG